MRRELLGANRARRGASSTSVWRTALVVALGALGAVSSAHGQASTLRIAVSQGLDGAFASPPCASAPPAAELATRAATVRAAVDRGAIAVDTGSFLGVAAIGQMAIVHDSEGLASAVRASGLSALALARRDLAAPRAILVRAAEAFRRASTPYVLSNLACDAPAADVCAPIVDASDPPHLVRVAGQRVAVISAVHPSALTHVANDRAASLSLQDPAPALARATRAARASGAERVIAIYDPRRDEALEDALAVARAIAPRDAPDVLLVNDIASSVERITVAEHQRMHLVATRDAVTELELTEDGARSAAATAHAPVPEAIAFERAMAQTICREESRSLRGARLVSPIDPSGLLGLFADVLRSYARADVSVINQGVIDRRRFRSLRGRLRRLDVLLAVPFDNAIRVTRVKGSALRAAFTAAARQQFLFRGLELEGSAVRVNGRALEDDAEYVVSATDFVADTNALGQGLTWTPFGHFSARESLLRYLDLPRARDPRVEADDPSRYTRWTFRLVINGALQAVQVTNPSSTIVTDAQLTRAQAISANVSVDGRINADHPDYSWENTLTARYGFVRRLDTMSMASTMSMMPPRLINETSDLLSLRSVFTFRGLRSRVPRWYVPSPYAELYVESEFTRPDARPFHHLELRPTGGARFPLNDRFNLFFGYGASAEVLARREDLPLGQQPIVGTFQLGWVLQPGPLFKFGGREAQWDSTLDLAIRDVFRLPGIQLRGRLGLRFPLIGPLSLTVGYDLFVRFVAFERNAEGQSNAYAFANDVEVGLGFNWTHAAQTFAR